MTEQSKPSTPERDVEKNTLLDNGIEKLDVKDPNMVTWDATADQDNPKNWPRSKKWSTTLAVSCFTFISPVSSSMIAPALSNVALSFSITSSVQVQMTLSIFVLAYAFGPLFFGPVSEVYGRTRTLQMAMSFYFVWNLGCGFAKNDTQIIVFRFLSGIGGSAPLAIGGGVLGDLWLPHERGAAGAIFSLAPILGPAAAPVCGAWIAERSTWRWTFWSTCIADAAIQIIGGWYLPETYAPVILQRRADFLRKETGNMKLYTEFDSDKTLGRVLVSSLPRPFRMLTTQPIVQLIAVYMAYIFGIMYLLLSTFPGVYEGIYGQSPGIAGLHYLSFGLGSFIGGLISAKFSDAIYRSLTKREGPSRPEYRIPLMFAGSLLIPIGLFWYGFSAAARLHWIMPDVGIVIFSAGSMMCLQCMQMYTIDSYTKFAASAVAAAVVLRSLAGFGFPLFAPTMYKALGYGWGNGLLGFVGIVIGIPAPFCFWFFGEKLRSKSTYASG